MRNPDSCELLFSDGIFALFLSAGVSSLLLLLYDYWSVSNYERRGRQMRSIAIIVCMYVGTQSRKRPGVLEVIGVEIPWY